MSNQAKYARAFNQACNGGPCGVCASLDGTIHAHIKMVKEQIRGGERQMTKNISV